LKPKTAGNLKGLEMQISKKLHPLLSVPKRFKVAIGGRGSGKSTTVADLMLMKAQTERCKVGCFREYQNSIDDSVYSLLTDEISRLSIPGFSIQKTAIDHTDGGGLRFRGLARSIDAIKSMHGFKYFWVEEAQFLSGESIKILTPTARELDSEIWFTGNPMSSADPFSQRFIVPYLAELQRDGYYEDDMHLIIMCNYTDNPWFPLVLEQERQHDYKTLDRALYDHIWNGAFNDFVEDSIIRAEWFDACVDAHTHLGFKPAGAVIAAHDPSDLGPDDKAIAVRCGSVLLDAQSRAIGDVNQGADWAAEIAKKWRADVFVWDCDGMGVSLRRQFAQTFKGQRVELMQFRGSNAVEHPDEVYQEPGRVVSDDTQRKTNKMTFRNRRAQAYWQLRDRVLATYQAVTQNKYTDPDTLISFSSDIPDIQRLRSELCRIPRKSNANGMLQIMTKPEMKRLLKIESPNLADAVMMTMVEPTPLIIQYSPAQLQPAAEAAY
jgi:phage terminase large subunit